MNISINNTLLPVDKKKFEFIERKGIGHPDTLSDHLAETLSRDYSNFTKKRFGAVLHHNFDKVGILGGKSFVSFGRGHMTEPVRVLVNGRVSTSFAGEKIDYKSFLEEIVYSFFEERFGSLIGREHIAIYLNLSDGSSNGKTDEHESEKGSRKYWFEPRGLEDLYELSFLHANDTSLGCGFAPLTKLEQTILEIEGKLNSKAYKSIHPWCGSDIKTMGTRIDDHVDITLCVPQIANYVKSLDEYVSNLEIAREDIKEILKKNFKENYSLHLNTRDDPTKGQLYLTATGSSIESGDEGLVGRGNRINGLITNTRPMSMEGASGKNPIYHVGKVYNLAAFKIANDIFEKTGLESEVFLVSQTGSNLKKPWKVCINVNGDVEKQTLEQIAQKTLMNIESISDKILSGKVLLA